jgi:spermidine synthase
MSVRIRTLYLLFAVSGFCGLIYESIWSHYLKLFLGHAAYAQTVVLIVFIGGLALGSWLAGRFATRIKRPLLAYAAAELVVGISALLFHAAFIASTGWAYDTLLPAFCSAEHWCWAQWAFAGLLILPQSVLLGTTFPLMSGGILRLDPSLPGGKLSLLYFLNSIGAVGGVMASGFVLIPSVGLPGALFTAGIMNVALALVVYFVDKGTHPAPIIASPAAAGQAPLGAPAVRMLLAIALLTGLSSFVYEIAWIRSLSLVLGATTHSFELMLASFILGLALGGLWIRSRIDRIGDIVRFLAVVQILMGLAAVATLPIYNSSFDLFSWMLGSLRSSDAGWLLFNFFSSSIALLVMLPATFMAGMTLPLITYALLRSPMGERSIGQVYAANTLGGILGVILGVHFALPVLGLKGALLLGGAIDIALGCYLLLRERAAVRRFGVAWSAMGIAGIVAASLLFDLDPRKLASGIFGHGKARLEDSYQLLYHRDGKTTTIDVFQHMPTGVISIATNGKIDGSIVTQLESQGAGADEYTMILSGALPLAHRPDARTAAVIGFGTGITTTTLLGSPRIERVDTIEIEPSMVGGASVYRFFTESAYTDPRSHIIIDDAKSYFARSGKRYDLIVSEPSNPWVSGVSSLFTQEFYARVRGQLNEEGLLVQWIQLYSFNEQLLASIVRALRTQFPQFVVYASNMGDLILVASPSGPVPPASADVFKLAGIKGHLERLEIRRIEDINLRRVGDHRTLETLFAPIDAPPNSDYFPVVDTRAAKARFLAGMVHQVNQMATAPWPIGDMAGSDAALRSYPFTIARWPASARVKEAQVAELARAFIMGEKSKDDVREGLASLYRPLTLFKAIFVDCEAAVSAAEWWDSAITTAALVSAHLSPEASERVWNRVAKSPCYARWDESTRNWFGVFRAVGRRDREATVTAALPLLETATEDSHFEYLYGASMTALVGMRRADEADELYRRFHGRLSETKRKVGWFRWMEGAVLQGAMPK